MKFAVSCFVVFLCTTVVLSCTSSSSSGLRSAQQQSNYPNLLEKQVSSRVGIAPNILLNDLMGMDSKTSYASHELTSEERHTFESVLSGLPVFLLKSLQTEVLDIYFVDNFSGGGMTYFVWQNGKPKYILLFNPKTLHQSLSSWLTYRDNTAFTTHNSSLTLRETESDNHVGFLHTLVHESLHVYDFDHSITKTPDGRLTVVSSKTWQDQVKVNPDFDYPCRSGLSFYDFEDKPKVPILELVSDMERFSHTGFASLYGSLNSMDDFAENETYVLLDSFFGIKLTLEILDNGRVMKSFTPSMSPEVIGKNSEFKRILIESEI